MRQIDTYLAALTRRTRMAHTRGLWRVCEWLRRHFVMHYAARPDPWVTIDDFAGSLHFRLNRSFFIGSGIYWNGAHSPNELALLDRLLGPEMVFADVGANQGELTVFAASRLDRGHVLAFEPLADLHRQLLDNIALNGFRNVTVRRLALSDRPGRMMLFVDRRSREGFNEGTASFFAGGERTSPEEVVEVACFDDVFEGSGSTRLDVIKIDVEGAEISVLRGAARALARHRPHIILELREGNFTAAGYATRDVLAFLADHRYEISLIGHGGRLTRVAFPGAAPIPESCNVLCVPA